MWLHRTGIADPYATSPWGGHTFFLAVDTSPTICLLLLEGDFGKEVLVVVVVQQRYLTFQHASVTCKCQ